MLAARVVFVSLEDLGNDQTSEERRPILQPVFYPRLVPDAELYCVLFRQISLSLHGHILDSGRLLSRCLRSVFSVFFDMLLRPFMSAVTTLVQVLELFNINDHRFALMDDEGSVGWA